MKGIFTGQANKFVIAVLGAVAEGLSSYYGTAKWEPLTVAIVTALATYVVPNLPKKS